MAEQFVRQLTMLRAVPRHPRKTTTRQIREALAAQGYEVTQRTVQRDLKHLADYLPDLRTDGNPDQAGWYWQRDSLRDLPGLDTARAMTFALAQRFLRPLLPPAILDQLKPYFDDAQRVLAQLDRPGFAGWMDKVRILPRTQPLIPASVVPEVVEGVYTALLEGRQFRARYRRRHGDEAEYLFNPLGLVARDSVIYLVATLWDYSDPRHFALHRFLRCELQSTPAQVPDGFSLDDYLRTGSFLYPTEPSAPMALAVRFSREAALHLEETPVSLDQVLVPDSPGWVRLTATLTDSQQLRWWLLGFGSQVEVLGPPELRHWFAQEVRQLAERYRPAEGDDRPLA